MKANDRNYQSYQELQVYALSPISQDRNLECLPGLCSYRYNWISTNDASLQRQLHLFFLADILYIHSYFTLSKTTTSPKSQGTGSFSVACWVIGVHGCLSIATTSSQRKPPEENGCRHPGARCGWKKETEKNISARLHTYLEYWQRVVSALSINQ